MPSPQDLNSLCLQEADTLPALRNPSCSHLSIYPLSLGKKNGADTACLHLWPIFSKNLLMCDSSLNKLTPSGNVHSHFGGQPVLWETHWLWIQTDLVSSFWGSVSGKLLSYSDPELPVKWLWIRFHYYGNSPGIIWKWHSKPDPLYKTSDPLLWALAQELCSLRSPTWQPHLADRFSLSVFQALKSDSPQLWKTPHICRFLFFL